MLKMLMLEDDLTIHRFDGLQSRVDLVGILAPLTGLDSAEAWSCFRIAKAEGQI